MSAVSKSEQLEGEPVSLWLATVGTTDHPVLSGDIEVDVAVIGGGIVGLTAALALTRSGRTVAVVEAARVGTGVTGHTTGKVTSLHRLVYSELRASHDEDTARAYGQANQSAIEHLARTVSEEGIDCDFRRVANYTYAETDKGLAAVRQEAALTAELGLPGTFTTDIPLPFDVKGAVRFDDQAHIHAVKYLQGLARAVAGAGGFIFEETRAQSFTDGSPCVVRTAQGHVRASDVLVATNVPFGDRGLFDTRCHPHRSYLVAGRVETQPLDGTFISAEEPLRSILSISIDGASYMLAGGEGHHLSEPGDAAERYRRLASFAHDRLAVGHVAYRWSTQDGIPVDGLPYVGLMSPAAKHVYVVTGLRKWGLSNGTAAALVLTDTICGRENPWAKVFNSNRITPRASTARLVKENIKTAFTGLKSKFHKTPGHATLAPGEGRVVKIDGEKTAVYKDHDGHSYAVSAICTHLGCTVEFNPADTTWDCPCHGSRYTTDGKVIHGPATKNLAPISAPTDIQ